LAVALGISGVIASFIYEIHILQRDDPSRILMGARSTLPAASEFFTARRRHPCSISSWSRSASAFLPRRSSTSQPATGSEGFAMIVDYALGGLVSVILLVYLVYALLRPERF
jgi:K+-transporting ATPase KdpF subunit